MNDLWKITDALEGLEDEVLAVSLLAEFNAKLKEHHTLLKNEDPNLDHDQWKRECDKAQEQVHDIVNRILSYKKKT